MLILYGASILTHKNYKRKRNTCLEVCYIQESTDLLLDSFQLEIWPYVR